MSFSDIPALKRPSFFDGQRLTAADLVNAQTYHRELRWLHNRCLHNWGIVLGFAVTGKRGQRSVQVQAGFALDCKGRELILTEGLEMAIPAVAGAPDGGSASYYLTVSYVKDEKLTAEMRVGMCKTEGAVRRSEKPLLRWQDPDGDFQHGRDVVLASIQVENCQLAANVSAAERRDAIPAQQPYVAAGQTTVGETTWQLWPNDEDPVGVSTMVNTASAGFRVTPRYQAHVVGDRFYAPEPDSDDVDVQVPIVVDGYAQVIAPTAVSFELVVTLPQGLVVSDDFLNPPGIVLTQDFMDRLRDELGWSVVWMGVEG